MEPDELFHRCLFQWFRKLAQLSGMDVFLIHYKPTVQTYTNVAALFVFLISCIWTIYAYEFDEKIICAAVLAFNCQGIVKYHSIFTHAKVMKDVCDFSLKVYKANKNSSLNKTCLNKSIIITVFIFKYGLVLLVMTAILVFIRPYASYFLGGPLETILPTYLPGINEQELVGYIALAVYHTYILFFFVVGTAGCDLALMTLVVHCRAMSLIFQNTVNDLNKMIENNKHNILDQRINGMLHNLILMHNDFIKYTRMLKLMYSEMCLIQISMANTIMIVLVYVILMMNWFPAYFLMATAFFQVFEFSILGTIVEIANDNILKTVCNISVAELPIHEQKKVVLMILLAQNPHNLTIGGFAPINVETFVSAMQRTYTVGMLLVNTRRQ